jgi:DNA-binding NtrC family response regulator
VNAMGDVLYVPAVQNSGQGRRAERRRGAATLLQSVINALSIASGPAAVRERFEQELRSMVRARAVAVCEGSTGQQPAATVMVFDIPSVVLAQSARIEVVFDPGRTLDGWTCELLEAATHVAALVLEIERALGRPPQFARVRRDGAAPLIGSSRAIRQVRERIERVAATDFTILIEGGIGPQPHLNFIEFSCGAAVRDGYRAVAGAGKDGPEDVK